jgi:hypothetical protein
MTKMTICHLNLWLDFSKEDILKFLKVESEYNLNV